METHGKEVIVFGTRNIGNFYIFVLSKTLTYNFTHLIKSHLSKNISKLVQLSPWHWLHIVEQYSPVYLHPSLHPYYTSDLVQQDCQSPQEPVTHPCLVNTMHMLIFHYMAAVEQCGTHGTVMPHCLKAVFVTQIRWIMMICWWIHAVHDEVALVQITDSEGILHFHCNLLWVLVSLVKGSQLYHGCWCL